MKDYLISKENKNDFVLNYEIKDNEIIIYYADKKIDKINVDQRELIINNLESKMINQVLESKLLEEIANKKDDMKVVIVLNGVVISFISLFVLDLLMHAKVLNGLTLVLSTALTTSIADIMVKLKSKNLNILEEDYNKNLLYIENIDKFNIMDDDSKIYMRDLDLMTLKELKILLKKFDNEDIKGKQKIKN